MLNLTSKTPGLALTLTVNTATKVSTVWQGVSEYQSHSLWKQSRSLASYNKIPKQLIVRKMEYHSLEVRYIQLPVLILVTVTELFKWPTVGSTSSYSSLLLFGRNLMILLLIVSARLVNKLIKTGRLFSDNIQYIVNNYMKQSQVENTLFRCMFRLHCYV